MPSLVVKWIMACGISAQFVVLVNGAPTSFFKSGRGMRKGFSLSPLLFLLIIEGLSRLILEAKNKGKLKGVKVRRKHFITHLLFVDNVMVFGTDSLDEWLCYKEIINLFCKASGMSVS